MREEVLAAFEERADALEWQVVDLFVRADSKVVEDSLGEVDMAGERLAVLAAVFDALAVFALELRILLALRDREGTVAGRLRRGEVAESGALELLREVVLPLGVGALRQRLGCGNAEVREHGPDVLRCRAGSAGVAYEVDDQIARADVVGQLVQQCEAALLEVLLYADLIRTALERAELVGELEAIGAELRAGAG